MHSVESDGKAGGTRLLVLLALLSGCCALAYEILYLRALTTLLGDMLYVHAALLSTFLVGIGFGAKLAHVCLRWLWLFEVLTGVYALALPRILRWMSAQPWMSEISGSPSLTIVTTVAFLSIPGLLVGFSIPLFSAYIKERARGRLAFQGVYIAYNLGALLSILVVEFVMVRALGVQTSLAAIGAVNLFNGIVLLALRATARRPDVRRVRFAPRIVLALALASTGSAMFQMFFFKLNFLVFNPHRENFAVGLSVTMLGIFAGAWLASRVRVDFATFLALVPVLIGGVYLAYVPILELHQMVAPWSEQSEWLVLLRKFGFGCIFALGPMLLFGAMLPALMRSERDVADESGHLLWVSSLANAAGYLGYVLLGHPFLSTGTLLALVAGVAVLASLLGAGFRWSRLQAAYAVVGIVLVVLMLGRWQDRNFYLAQWFDEIEPEDEIVVFKSGAESATLHRSDDEEWISYNGHASVYVQRHGRVTLAEMLDGIVPALAAPSLERALVLGLGTGISAGAASRVFEHTDVVEINDAFYKMAPHLSHANLDISNNPSATLHLNDGRTFLIGKVGLYDAVINSIPAPTYFSASKIYTLEFYERVKKALKPGGVYMAWLAVPNMSEAGVQVVLSSLYHNFRYCDLRLMSAGYYSSTCSDEPLKLRSFRELPCQLVLLDALQNTLRGFDLREFFEDIRLSENLFDHYVPKVPRENTDDHPVLEFMVVRSFQLGAMGDDPFVEQQELLNVDPVRQHELAGDVHRLARRADVFRRLKSEFYERNFLPLIEDAADVPLLRSPASEP